MTRPMSSGVEDDDELRPSTPASPPVAFALAFITRFSPAFGFHVTVVPSRVPLCSTTSPGNVIETATSKPAVSELGSGSDEADGSAPVESDRSRVPLTTKKSPSRVIFRSSSSNSVSGTPVKMNFWPYLPSWS